MQPTTAASFRETWAVRYPAEWDKTTGPTVTHTVYGIGWREQYAVPRADPFLYSERPPADIGPAIRALRQRYQDVGAQVQAAVVSGTSSIVLPEVPVGPAPAPSFGYGLGVGLLLALALALIHSRLTSWARWSVSALRRRLRRGPVASVRMRPVA